MAISRVGSNASSGTGTTASITHGLTISAGNFVVAFLALNGSNNAVTPGSFVTDLSANFSTGSSSLAILSKQATASEPATYSFPISASDRWTLTVIVFGGNGIAWDVLPAVREIPGATAQVLNQITTLSANAELVAFAATDTNNATYSGFTAGYTTVQATGGQTAFVANKVQAAAGPTGNLSYTVSSALMTLGAFGALKESGPAPTLLRKSSTLTATHTLGTITTATLNGVNVFDHVSSQAAGTISFTGAITDEITTSGAVNLVLGDGAATQTQTIQVNVFGVVPSNNPAQKDGVALASLTNVQVRITSGTGLNGVQRFYSPTETTDASGNFSTLDLSSSVAADADPVLMHVLTAAGDSIISSETVGLI
jgi:hypothetical protein